MPRCCTDKDAQSMSFFTFLLVAGATYLIWRITDQLPDLIFRISEIQRDVAELRRAIDDSQDRNGAPSRKPDDSPKAPTAV
jgi:hypothetical protein